jgi:hypothetical protein
MHTGAGFYARPPWTSPTNDGQPYSWCPRRLIPWSQVTRTDGRQRTAAPRVFADWTQTTPHVQVAAEHAHRPGIGVLKEPGSCPMPAEAICVGADVQPKARAVDAGSITRSTASTSSGIRNALRFMRVPPRVTPRRACCPPRPTTRAKAHKRHGTFRSRLTSSSLGSKAGGQTFCVDGGSVSEGKWRPYRQQAAPP